MADHNVDRSLTRTLNGASTVGRELDVSGSHRLAILSDQHKGAGDGADEFRKCVDAYVAALASYLRGGFTLVLLGDVEELWENSFAAVERTYRGVLELERAFPADRYIRVWGNHDDRWMEASQVRSKLRRYLPSGTVCEAVRYTVRDGAAALGTLLLLHGHQGTFGSDTIRPISRLALRLLYRPIAQNLLGIGKTTPARDACLRGRHDRDMYEWARAQRKLILIAGHTHRPVWAGETHVQHLEAELHGLDPSSPHAEELRQEILIRRAKSPPCNDVTMDTPCYFNTGCCRFDDGDITGMELEDGMLRLVRWSSAGARTPLEEEQLRDVFKRLP